MGEVIITGPFSPTTPDTTPSRDRIFMCQPESPATDSVCAEQILTALARRAYRRPVTDADLRVVVEFYEDGRRDGGFDAGIERALTRVLTSPSFLFRVEADPTGVAAGGAYEGSWRRVGRFSSGAVFLTMSCSLTRNAAAYATQRCASNRCGAC